MITQEPQSNTAIPLKDEPLLDPLQKIQKLLKDVEELPFSDTVKLTLKRQIEGAKLTPRIHIAGGQIVVDDWTEFSRESLTRAFAEFLRAQGAK